jgi:putative addiction module killer protein
MKTIRQTETFRTWESRLKDKVARAAIAARIFRLANGLEGDAAPVGEGISEMRIHFGPGYRLYYKQENDRIVILLCGGSKRKQEEDIRTAKRLAKELSGGDPQ